MKIRIAKSEDLDAIVSIYNQAIASGQKTADITPVSPESRVEWFNNHMPNKYPIIVAEEDYTIVGYLSISAYRPGRMALRYTAEVSYYVNFDHQGHGIGSDLMQYAINMCPRLQLKTLFAILIDSNHVSIGLLEKFGFKKWGQMPGVADFDGIEIGQVYYGLRVQ
jgi:L-amino acid N-acyltransferase YncA